MVIHNISGLIMRFKGLDLNLLLTLETLLQERSVSAAARRINMSQPAVSAMRPACANGLATLCSSSTAKALSPAPMPCASTRC
jgi:hypothetical protein